MYSNLCYHGVMTVADIQKTLFSLQDTAYRDFQAALLPTVQKETVIGVRTPALRAFAKQLVKESSAEDFLHTLPHQYFDENQVHAFVLSEQKDMVRCIEGVCQFLPYVDNWATCDQLSPKVFKKHKTELLSHIQTWLCSEHPYTVRFAIGMLMQHFLDKDFDSAYPKLVAAVRSDAYYVNMMVAWYFATALAKQYAAVLPFITQKRLAPWTHNKAIQKALESYRITDEQKTYLRTYKIPRTGRY